MRLSAPSCCEGQLVGLINGSRDGLDAASLQRATVAGASLTIDAICSGTL